MRFNLADPVVARKDIPEEGVRLGTVGFVVHIHGNHEAYTVEFSDLSGVVTGLATKEPGWFSPYVSTISARVSSPKYSYAPRDGGLLVVSSTHTSGFCLTL